MKQRRYVLLSVSCILILSMTYLCWANIDKSNNSSNSIEPHQDAILELTQSKGNVRVTFMGISSGLTFRTFKNAIVSSEFGQESYRYVQALFLVEQLGEIDGSNGAIKLIGPQGELKFNKRVWGPCDYGFYESMKRFAVTAALPEKHRNSTDAYVYKMIWEVEPGDLPKELSISAQFFGEMFNFSNVRLP